MAGSGGCAGKGEEGDGEGEEAAGEDDIGCGRRGTCGNAGVSGEDCQVQGDRGRGDACGKLMPVCVLVFSVMGDLQLLAVQRLISIPYLLALAF